MGDEPQQRRSRRSGVEDLWTKVVRDADGNTSRCRAPGAAAGCVGGRAMSTSAAASTPRRSAGRSTRSGGWMARPLRSCRGLTLRRGTRSSHAAVVRSVDRGVQGASGITVRTARVHIAQIVNQFGDTRCPRSARPRSKRGWLLSPRTVWKRPTCMCCTRGYHSCATTRCTTGCWAQSVFAAHLPAQG